VEPVVWDSRDGSSARIAKANAVVIRSCWDYIHRPVEFVRWIAGLEQAGARVHNPSTIVEWNADKRYLRTLEARGAKVLPTLWLDDSTSNFPVESARARGWDEVVIKPIVSNGGVATRRLRIEGTSREEIDHAVAEAAHVGRGAMVQPFAREITEAGEWSFLFFRGAFSHAVVKRSSSGEFRVQEIHGGTTARAFPHAGLLAQAEHVVRSVGVDLLYARVDGIERDGALIVIELELIEPTLFLAHDPYAVERCASAILEAARGA
jgi:glutathione synthase/RimK-type ligase-like ATP-grasp enzyme